MKYLALPLLLFLPLLLGRPRAESQEAAWAVFSRSEPEELRFGCALILNDREQTLVKGLIEGHQLERVAAARALWHGHSRRHAREVIQFVFGDPLNVDTFPSLKRDVTSSLEPQEVLRELRNGDYRWGAWLAFLRPHQDLVPELMAGLKDKPDYLPETMLALGKSRDRRALEPLLGLLKSEDYWIPGVAAQALGYLAAPEAEPKLIEALSQDSSWLRVKACGALAKIGTRRALPALERLARDQSYTGVLNVRGMASYAIDSIKKRDEL